jgi:hypothetical protein
LLLLPLPLLPLLPLLQLLMCLLYQQVSSQHVLLQPPAVLLAALGPVQHRQSPRLLMLLVQQVLLLLLLLLLQCLPQEYHQLQPLPQLLPLLGLLLLLCGTGPQLVPPQPAQVCSAQQQHWCCLQHW